MIGGKWTTFRSFGELAADMALDRLGQIPSCDDDRRVPLAAGGHFPADIGGMDRAVGRRNRAFRQQRVSRAFRTLWDGRRGDRQLHCRGTGRRRAASPAILTRETPFPDPQRSVEHLDDLLLQTNNARRHRANSRST